MKSPENKTLSFLFHCVPGTRSQDAWALRVTLPPGTTAKTQILVDAVGEGSKPITKGTFEFMGTRVKIAKGIGHISLEQFMAGIHETGVWMMRPGHPPVPGALTFG